MTTEPNAHAVIRRPTTGDALVIATLIRASITELCIIDHKGRDELSDWLREKTAANVECWIRNPVNIMLVVDLERAVAALDA